MARPAKCRRICQEPQYRNFRPEGEKREDEVVLSFDEYEAIRLIDYEKKTHEQCADLMQVSRPTVSDIYENARYKISDCVINGKNLRIAGGNYRICEGEIPGCSGKRCCKKQCHKSFLEHLHPLSIHPGEINGSKKEKIDK